MANIDQIFTKSNLDENKKKSKMMFGRILINLRKANHIKLYSLLESVIDTNIVSEKLEIVLGDKTAYDMINNKSDISLLDETLKAIDSTLAINISCSGKEPFDMFKFEKTLRDEFGKLLTIKTKN